MDKCVHNQSGDSNTNFGVNKTNTVYDRACGSEASKNLINEIGGPYVQCLI